jgi:hypothetical protein
MRHPIATEVQNSRRKSGIPGNHSRKMSKLQRAVIGRPYRSKGMSAQPPERRLERGGTQHQTADAEEHNGDIARRNNALSS